MLKARSVRISVDVGRWWKTTSVKLRTDRRRDGPARKTHSARRSSARIVPGGHPRSGAADPAPGIGAPLETPPRTPMRRDSGRSRRDDGSDRPSSSTCRRTVSPSFTGEWRRSGSRETDHGHPVGKQESRRQPELAVHQPHSVGERASGGAYPATGVGRTRRSTRSTRERVASGVAAIRSPRRRCNTDRESGVVRRATRERFHDSRSRMRPADERSQRVRRLASARRRARLARDRNGR
jgi:hypothetical protein